MRRVLYILIGLFLLSSCKKDECNNYDFENQNCNSYQECRTLHFDVITLKLLKNKWEVTNFLKDGSSLNDFVGDKLELRCKEFYENSCFCDDGTATWKKNTFTKHKADWGLNKEKRVSFYDSNEKFPLGKSYRIVKLTNKELVLELVSLAVEEVHLTAK